VGRGIGGVGLGMRRGAARRAMGLPATERSRWMTWCFDGGGRLVAALHARGDRARVDLVLTDAAPFDTHGIRPGTRARSARARLRGERRIGRARGVTVFAKRERRRLLLVGLRRRRVAYLAVARRPLSNRRALRYLRTLP
jgi:hypothetical protein